MDRALLLFPLIACAAGVAGAALLTLPAVNRRLSSVGAGWLLALAPAAAFAALCCCAGRCAAGQALAGHVEWMPTLGLRAALYLDGLGLLFALLVTGIGALVLVYSGYYFQGKQVGRFHLYLLLFMTAMLGVVLAGDVVTLFVFWEGTSVTSFLLIGYKTQDEAARRGAFQALLITGTGGIALLAGLLMVSAVVGSTELAAILGSGDLLRQSPWYPAIIGLLALGAFTKSAQAPFHIWLPAAMSAPTPASAYLHSATMVKAGIYLLARMNPVLGFTDAWFWLLSLSGLVTMLVGAYVGLKQNDLKALLAYSTISQLGVLMMLIGQDTAMAFKALVIGVLAHALYKSALFLVAGIVDHEAGTRDLRRLGGLGRSMPITLAIGGVAALSMAGLPPLFGFLAKETLLATVTHPNVPAAIEVLFPLAAVVTGALLLAQAGTLVVDTFLGRPRGDTHAHEAPWGMWLAPALPALLSLLIGLLPEPDALARLLANAAAAAYGGTVKVSLALWTGISVPLLLSGVAIACGGVLFALRRRVRAWQERVSERVSFAALYTGALWLVDRLAYLATRTQAGQLRRYLVVMLLGLGVLVALWGNLPLLTPLFTLPTLDLQGELSVLRIFALFLAVAAAVVSIVLRRDLPAIMALGASTLSVTVLMVLEPAPDVALVQIAVDILTIIILLLVLTRLPRALRERANESSLGQSRRGLLRDILVAGGSGFLVAAISLAALVTRPRATQVTPFYEAYAKPLTGAGDIVSAILVEFRGFDTLIEIGVFGAAGLAIYTLLRYAAAKDRVREAADEERAVRLTTHGIGGTSTSSFVHALAYVTLPVTMVIAVTHMIYGHDQPGDGFTAGVIVSLGVGFWYIVFGYHETKRRLRWLRSVALIGSGSALVLVSAAAPTLLGLSFFAPLNYGALAGLPLPDGFDLSTAFFFEVAIFLVVLGSATLFIDTLGRPQDRDTESDHRLEEISSLEKQGACTSAAPEQAGAPDLPGG